MDCHSGGEQRGSCSASTLGLFFSDPGFGSVTSTPSPAPPRPAVAAIHAGAAIHCWPNPQAALAEISRVLRPGGVFVASTFLNFTAPLGQLVGNDDLVAPLSQVGGLVQR